MQQQTLAMAADQGAGFEQYRRPTKRDVFLEAMEQIVPWAQLCEVIEPYYPKGVGGRPPVGLERMLRMHFVQHWFNLADVACEEALLDGTALRRFVGIDLGRERVPDDTTLLKFRRLLHGDEQRVYGDSAYASQKELIASKAPKAKDFTNERVRNRRGEIDEAKRSKYRNKSKIRARVEHVFAVVKRLWGFGKVRYRGLAKNAATVALAWIIARPSVTAPIASATSAEQLESLVAATRLQLPAEDLKLLNDASAPAQ
ncbi:aldo/keto reductase [Paraburkholderia fungorum]|uniref:aldo/keto reductase n=1 Tax=Paraburkholderia fungorum TaxID=134537 RepID=UPI0038B8309E